MGGLDTVSLLGIERRAPHQFQHTEHTVHGRADLVAHVRQKLGLGSRRRQGRGIRRLELFDVGLELLVHVRQVARTRAHLVFQAIVLVTNVAIPALDLFQQFVEASVQIPHFVVAFVLDPAAVVLLPAQAGHLRAKPRDRAQQQALHGNRYQVRADQARQQGDADQ